MPSDLIFKDCVLFSDIDGTLITYDKKLPERNMAAIKEFKRLGGRFTICTGRSAESLKRAFDVSLLNFPAIIFNGGGIYDFGNKRLLKDSELPENARPYVEEVFEKYCNVGIEINVDSVLYCVKYSERSNRHILTENSSFRVYSISELPDGAWKKVLFTGEKKDIDILSEDLLSRNVSGKGYYFLRSEPGLFELLPENAKKGFAVSELSKIYNIPTYNIFAIGDYYNDLSMLSAAGVSCAVAGAPDEVKAAADYVSCPCEDGAVADFIEHIKELVKNRPAHA